MMRRPKLMIECARIRCAYKRHRICKKVDPDNARADYFIGKAYVHRAKSILLPTSIKAPGYTKAFKAQRKCYEEAKPHLERFRKAAPDAPRLWAPLLYDVYLNLNLGKEFEEISKYNPV